MNSLIYEPFCDILLCGVLKFLLKFSLMIGNTLKVQLLLGQGHLIYLFC